MNKYLPLLLLFSSYVFLETKSKDFFKIRLSTGWIVGQLSAEHICKQLYRLKAWYYKIIMGSSLEKESMLSKVGKKNFFCLKITFLSINLSKNLKK